MVREIICCSRFVPWVVIVKPVGSCLACDILYLILHTLPERLSQLRYYGFSCPMIGQILLRTQILQRWVLFHVFHDFIYGVFFSLGFSCTKRLKSACRWQGSKADRFSSFRSVALPDTGIVRLNNMTGHLSSFPVANILSVTGMVFTPSLLLVSSC